MSVRIAMSKLLILNVTGESQILRHPHNLLPAVIIPQFLILPASLLFSLSHSVYLNPPSFPSPSQIYIVSLPISLSLRGVCLYVSLSLSRVLEDLSNPRGRKSIFLPHQLSEPGVEKAQLKAPLLLMLTANANVPFAKHEGQWAQTTD